MADSQYSLTPKDRLKIILGNASGAPLFLLVLLSMIAVPLPAIVLDMFFTVNIALSIMILMICVYSKRPADFSIFPTVLLSATLLRLGLNVASTRLILTSGHSGGGGAGQVIESFGEFVIGGDFAVGVVVFLILIIINFMVVTKGSERISEVNARFTLDSLPGKQMAIDAELNSGSITSEEAAIKREILSTESEFHGSMDGASKFVKGDAIAGLIILAINLVGGICIGVVQHGLPFSEALKTFSLLSIGDGLVAQIPALILSTATAIIISRSSGSQDLSEMIGSQMLMDNKVIYISGSILIIIGLVPGMPTIAFCGIGSAICIYAYYNQQGVKELTVPTAKLVMSDNEFSPAVDVLENVDGSALENIEQKELTLDDITPPEPIEICIGMRLVPLLDAENGAELIEQVTGVRKHLSQEMGVLIKGILIRDVYDMDSESYEIRIRGIVRGEGKVKPSMQIAIDMGGSRGAIDGIPTQDPVYGLPAYWIDEDNASQARLQGYEVSDPATVIITHLSQIMHDYMHVLLFHEDVAQIVDHMSKQSPKLIEELIPKSLTISRLLDVLRNLLREGISIQDINTILETLALHAPSGINTAELTTLVRKAMIEHIIYKLTGSIKYISVMTVNHELQALLMESINNDGRIIINGPKLADLLLVSHKECQAMISNGLAPIMVVADQLRLPLIKLLKPQIPEINILGFNELPTNIKFDIVAEIK
ncbi:flagellar biosynthesis protein FlhA [Photobacterium kishitanii]|uniref:flagellar biosynthesis protein FlhA n=1 Tax=Photobacterium kishitanii TaxID=318456 RepID=UPI00071AEFAF|nr:flagellar biosynthesis protein FlhA [Photobacterium kishitanii]